MTYVIPHDVLYAYHDTRDSILPTTEIATYILMRLHGKIRHFLMQMHWHLLMHLHSICGVVACHKSQDDTVPKRYNKLCCGLHSRSTLGEHEVHHAKHQRYNSYQSKLCLVTFTPLHRSPTQLPTIGLPALLLWVAAGLWRFYPSLQCLALFRCLVRSLVGCFAHTGWSLLDSCRQLVSHCCCS